MGGLGAAIFLDGSGGSVESGFAFSTFIGYVIDQTLGSGNGGTNVISTGILIDELTVGIAANFSDSGISTKVIIA